MADQHVRLEPLDGGVWELVLDRPPANAIDLDFARSFREAVEQLSEGDALRQPVGAVLVRSTGKLFCGGGDLTVFVSAGDEIEGLLTEVTAELHEAISGLAALAAPVIGIVQGPAAGAGMSLVAGLDLVVASDDATFTMGYTAAGLSIDGGGSYFLQRVVGLRRAMELVLTNRTLTATEALAWGLVNYVEPVADALGFARRLAQQLASGPTRAFGEAKRQLYEAAGSDLAATLERESRSIVARSVTAEGQEGMAAFVDRRAPDFS